MWLFVAMVLVFLGWLYQTREPFDPSPSDTVQEQAGAIQQLHETLSKITLSEASVEALQSESDQTTNQITQLKQNLPSKEPAKAYPPE
jgi:Tfp pilus assembly protein PilO